MELDLYCHGCDVTGPHQVDGREAACLSCATVREVEDDVLAVIDVAYCHWCKATLPVGHECRPDPTPCQSRTQLGTCGICDACLAAGSADPRYGPPSHIDHP